MAEVKSYNLDTWVEGRPHIQQVSDGTLDDWVEGAPIILLDFLGELEPEPSATVQPMIFIRM